MPTAEPDFKLKSAKEENPKYPRNPNLYTKPSNANEKGGLMMGVAQIVQVNRVNIAQETPGWGGTRGRGEGCVMFNPFDPGIEERMAALSGYIIWGWGVAR